MRERCYIENFKEAVYARLSFFLWFLFSVLLFVRILIEVFVIYLLYDSFFMFGSLLEIVYKFIRFNIACFLWYFCLMLLKVFIFFLLSFLNKIMFSFDFLIMIYIVESDFFFYLFDNGMFDIDVIIFFKCFFVCFFCNYIYIYRRVDYGWYIFKFFDGNLYYI